MFIEVDLYCTFRYKFTKLVYFFQNIELALEQAQYDEYDSWFAISTDFNYMYNERYS